MAALSQRRASYVQSRNPASNRSTGREGDSVPRSVRPRSPLDSGDDLYDFRRSRACDACRSSKVRCEQPNLDRPCKRCAKGRRECFSSTGDHKRRKNLSFNDQLMALNGKIDRLTAALRTGSKRNPKVPDFNHISAKDLNRSTTVTEGRLSHPKLAHRTPELASIYDPQQAASLIAMQPEFNHQALNAALKVGMVSEFVEISITKIISVRAANAYFERYRTELSANFPVVVIDPAASAIEIRSSKTVLFLAIIAAASDGDGNVGTQKRLQRLLTLVLTHCYSMNDEYNLELVQAFIVSALWYTPSDLIYGPKPVNMRQLSHAATNVAINIGLDKPGQTKSWDFGIARHAQDLQVLNSSPVADLEARRTWLGCYFIAANVSMASRQPNVLCWNQYMDACIETLETSLWALSSDKTFCGYIRLQRNIDEHTRKVFASQSFKPGSKCSVDKYEILHSFKRQLASDPFLPLSTTSKSTLGLLYYSSTLYVHEVIAAIDRDGDGTDPNQDGTQSAAPFRHRAGRAEAAVVMSECVHSAFTVISCFASLDHQQVRCMPAIFLIRVLHAMVFLIKFSCGTCLDQSPACKSFDRENARVERQLDTMIEIMASWGSAWPARRLIQICISLRRQLRDKSENSKVACDSAPCSLCSSHEDRDIELSNSNSSEPPTQSPYQRGLQEAFSFEETVCPIPDGTSFADSSFWDDFLEQVPASKTPVSPIFSPSIVWKAQQPQQYTLFSEADISND